MFRRFFSLISILIVFSFLFPPIQAVATVVEASVEAERTPEYTGLFRTEVTLDHPKDRQRLDTFGVVVIADGESWARLLANETQLETLRHFESLAADERERISSLDQIEEFDQERQANRRRRITNGYIQRRAQGDDYLA